MQAIRCTRKHFVRDAEVAGRACTALVFLPAALLGMNATAAAAAARSAGGAGAGRTVRAGPAAELQEPSLFELGPHGRQSMTRLVWIRARRRRCSTCRAPVW